MQYCNKSYAIKFSRKTAARATNRCTLVTVGENSVCRMRSLMRNEVLRGCRSVKEGINAIPKPANWIHPFSTTCFLGVSSIFRAQQKKTRRSQIKSSACVAVANTTLLFSKKVIMQQPIHIYFLTSA